MTRRGVLAGAAAAGVGVAAGALAACGEGGEGGGPASSASPATVPIADVPVGGAIIVGQSIVSQPEAGEFRAFSAVCTHQFCLITRVQESSMVECTCHGSQFSAVDGSVLRGPAQRPLDARTVTAAGDTLTVS